MKKILIGLIFSVNLFSQVPVITQQPISITAYNRCGAASFYVSIQATSFVTNIRWQKKQGLGNWLSISSVQATALSYTIQNPQFSDSGLYRVVISNPQGSTTSNSASLTVLPVPSIVFPLDSATNIPVNTVFKWRAYSKAISYSIQIYIYNPKYGIMRDFDECIFKKEGIPDTFCIVNDLLPDTFYYWQITASTLTETTMPSYLSIFKTGSSSIPLPFIPTLISPIKGESTTLNPILTWTDSSADSTFYIIEISTSPNFSPGIICSTFTKIDTVKQTLLPNTIYYWHVKAINKSGTKGWSQNEYFHTVNNATRNLIKETKRLSLGNLQKNTYNIRGCKLTNNSRSYFARVSKGIIKFK